MHLILILIVFQFLCPDTVSHETYLRREYLIHHKAGTNQMNSSPVTQTDSRYTHESIRRLVSDDSKLEEVYQKLHNKVPCFHLQHVNVVSDFMRSVWKEHIESYGIDVLVNSICSNPSVGIGNLLGTYFNSISCAMRTGVNVITMKKYEHSHQNHTIFYDNLVEDAISLSSKDREKVIPVPTSLLPKDHDSSTGIGRVKDICVCESNCWSNSDSPWLANIPYISKRMRRALDAYDKEVVDHEVGTLLHHINDRTTAAPGQYLPIIPDVSIQ